MDKVTAKVRLSDITQQAGGGHQLSFYADYANGRNEEWKHATPTLSMSMTVNSEAVKHFEAGKAYTLTFSEDTDG